MADTTFIDGSTLSAADWFNDVNRLHYTIFSDPADLATVKSTVRRQTVTARSSNTILAAADLGTTFVATSTFTQTLTAAATLASGWYVHYRNAGTGVITIDPNGAEGIDGLSTLALYPGDSCDIVCDGSNFYTVGLSRVAILASGTASGVASIDQFWPANSFRQITILADLVPSVDGTPLYGRGSTDGITFSSAASYSWSNVYSNTAAATVNAYTSLSTGFNTGWNFANGVDNTAGRGVTLRVDYTPDSYMNGIRWQSYYLIGTAGTDAANVAGSGNSLIAGLSGIQLLPGSGTLSGNYRVLGVRA